MNQPLNFDNQIREYIQFLFAKFGNPGYEQTDIDKDLINAFTIHYKAIQPIPRKVEFSKELENYLVENPRFKSMVNYLKLLFINGTDVNLHQSFEVFNHHTPDHLIFDWKIYHLHLSDKPDKERTYFTKRTNDLLFVYLEKERVFFLNIFPHEPKTNFSDVKLLQIIDNNWEGVLQEVTGVLGLSHNLTSDERRKLRKANINEGMLEVNGKFIATPNLGLVTSGKSLNAVKMKMDFSNWVRRNLDEINKDLPAAAQSYQTHYNLQNEVEFHLIFTETGPAIVDRKTGTVLIPWLHQYRHSKNTEL